MMIFWRLVLAHFISDFTLQTNLVASWKRVSWKGMAIHIMTHPIAMAVLLWPHLGDVWYSTPWFAVPGWLVILLITVTHWIEDEWRVRLIRTGWPDSTGLLLWDQFVHIAILFAIAPRSAGQPGEPWVGVVLCAVLLTHMVSVLIFFLENDGGTNSTVLVRHKYRFMAERAAGAALLCLPGAWGILGGFYVIGWGTIAWNRRKTYTQMHVVVGAVSTLVLGLAARSLIPHLP